MTVHFISLDGPRARSPTVITEFPVILTRTSHGGGDPAAEVVSPLHCEIDQQNGLLVVRDLNSRHGTFVNGVRVQKAYLWPGDKLTVGLGSFTVWYEQPDAVSWKTTGEPSAAAPSPRTDTSPGFVTEVPPSASPCEPSR
jgi:pSer/pThr/pTyr-binding forkhead associated (FHA) protein